MKLYFILCAFSFVEGQQTSRLHRPDANCNECVLIDYCTFILTRHTLEAKCIYKSDMKRYSIMNVSHGVDRCQGITRYRDIAMNLESGQKDDIRKDIPSVETKTKSTTLVSSFFNFSVLATPTMTPTTTSSPPLTPTIIPLITTTTPPTTTPTYVLSQAETTIPPHSSTNQSPAETTTPTATTKAIMSTNLITTHIPAVTTTPPTITTTEEYMPMNLIRMITQTT